MPELPEVETVVRAIRPDLVNRVVQSAWLDWSRALVGMDAANFRGRIAGQRVEDVVRRAKYIVVKLDADWLLIHLKMTGRLYVVPDNTVNEADKWVHFRFQLDNAHQLRFSDARKFGRVYLTSQPEDYLGKLGPEPLEPAFTPAVFAALLAKRKGALKALLLNQEFVAGVGNIYADEALHRAGLAPQRKSDSLNAAEIAALYHAIRDVLVKGIERQGATIGWYRRPDGQKGTMQDAFLVYGRAGQPCLTCEKGEIQRIVIGQRSTHYCPNCQR